MPSFRRSYLTRDPAPSYGRRGARLANGLHCVGSELGVCPVLTGGLEPSSPASKQRDSRRSSPGSCREPPSQWCRRATRWSDEDVEQTDEFGVRGRRRTVESRTTKQSRVHCGHLAYTLISEKVLTTSPAHCVRTVVASIGNCVLGTRIRDDQTLLCGLQAKDGAPRPENGIPPSGGSAFSDRLPRHLCQPGFSSKDECRNSTNSTNSRFVRIGQ